MSNYLCKYIHWKDLDQGPWVKGPKQQWLLVTVVTPHPRKIAVKPDLTNQNNCIFDDDLVTIKQYQINLIGTGTDEYPLLRLPKRLRHLLLQDRHS